MHERLSDANKGYVLTYLKSKWLIRSAETGKREGRTESQRVNKLIYAQEANEGKLPARHI